MLYQNLNDIGNNTKYWGETKIFSFSEVENSHLVPTGRRWPLQKRAESSLRAKFYPTKMEDLWVIVRVVNIECLDKQKGLWGCEV